MPSALVEITAEPKYSVVDGVVPSCGFTQSQDLVCHAASRISLLDRLSTCHAESSVEFDCASSDTSSSEDGIQSALASNQRSNLNRRVV
ncbi:hypothetical protein [Psychromonas sp. KJ10-2]|uniref:hypothetical protein n=1 Tax=Psychromonas sp. KJ10-2 TaxID=3391822 RepID=UPI0039B53B02